MKIKIKLGEADADRTEVHQVKSTTAEFDFRRVLLVHTSDNLVIFWCCY